MDDLLSEFLTESGENLALIDAQLIRLEQEPDDKDTLGSIFRLVHTIKGTCGFLGLPRLESVAHAGETVLGKFRDGEIEVTPGAVTSILKCIDCIRAILSDLEAAGHETEGDDSALIAELTAIAEGGGEAAPSDEPAQSDDAVAAEVSEPVMSDEGFPVAAELLQELEMAATGGGETESDAETCASEGPSEGDVAAPVPSQGAEVTPVETVTAPKISPAQKASVPSAAEGGDQASSDASRPSVANQSIRVAVETLETLMTLVSELVLTRNQLLQMVRGRDDSTFSAPLHRLSHITSELQEGVMKTRMQPIGNAWAKLPRIVRDLAVDTGKKLDLRMIGEDTELDRQVLELIKDPLTHMVRNSADHGIETPDERVAAGKPKNGTITLKAFHEGGHIIIEILDDGKGLNPEQLKQKVLSQELASEDELAAMSDEEVYQFIFRPGFSTAKQVTNVSGRGVGMDVVRTNVERIGGTIELKSTPGLGSTFTIKIPLTLAIVSGLILGCAGQRFAVPQISVRELVRVAGAGDTRIESVNGSHLFRLRDRLLPLVDLRSLLTLSETDNDGSIGAQASGEGDAQAQKEPFVVVMQVGTVSFGVIVDEVFDTEEIVVKPVASILRSIPYYAGNTILGDGSVIMILDPNGIVSALGRKVTQVSGDAKQSALHESETTRLLVFRAGGSNPKAVPLQLVARLEQIEVTQVEMCQDQRVIQYRDHLMPLVSFDEAMDWDDGTKKPVLVFTDSDHSMGLVVDEIVDVVEEILELEGDSHKEGIIGSAVIKGRATDVIDVSHHLTRALPAWFEKNGSMDSESPVSGQAILLIDDSSFFRDLIVPVLSAAGYRVTAVSDASEALRMRDAGREFDAIVSDIEMPGLNGFEFAELVKRDDRWGKTPLLALSAHADDSYFSRGRKAGFSDYVAKFDRDGLLCSLAKSVDTNGFVNSLNTNTRTHDGNYLEH